MGTEEIIKLLANTGIGGLAVYIIYLLHSQSLKAFREELTEERKMFREDRIQTNIKSDEIKQAIREQTTTLSTKLVDLKNGMAQACKTQTNH